MFPCSINSGGHPLPATKNKEHNSIPRPELCHHIKFLTTTKSVFKDTKTHFETHKQFSKQSAETVVQTSSPRPQTLRPARGLNMLP